MIWLTRLSIVLLLIAAASAAWWLDTSRQPALDDTSDAAVAELPDFYFTGFRISRYVADGAPEQILRGVRMDHYPATDSAEVDGPRLIHQPAAAPLWRIRGDTGTLLQDSDVVVLHGSVRLHRPGSRQVRPFTLLTPELTYAMQPEIARTDQPVRVLSPGTRVDAIGMTARLALGEVELLDQVHVTHDPALAGEEGADD